MEPSDCGSQRVTVIVTIDAATDRAAWEIADRVMQTITSEYGPCVDIQSASDDSGRYGPPPDGYVDWWDVPEDGDDGN